MKRIDGIDNAYKRLMLELVNGATEAINKGDKRQLAHAYKYLTEGMGKSIIDYFDIKPLISKICPKLSIYEERRGIRS